MSFGVARRIVLVCLVALVAGCGTMRPPETVRAHGDAAFAEGRFDAALADYQEYLDRRPHEARAYYDVGRTMLALDLPRPASQHLFVAYDREPLNDEYIDAYARSLADSGQKSELYRFLGSQTEQRGRVADYLRMGRFAQAAGDADEALQALLVAAQLDHGQHVEPQLALADFYQSVNDRANTLRRLRMAYFLSPRDEAIADRIRGLGEIPGPAFALQPDEWR